jgi:hypothetical protein
MGATVTNSTNNNNKLGRQHYFKYLCHYKYEAQQQESEIQMSALLKSPVHGGPP